MNDIRTKLRYAALIQQRDYYRWRLDNYGKRIAPGTLSAINEGVSREQLQRMIADLDGQLAVMPSLAGAVD